jgi:Domain of unknown function (DUF4394)
MASTNEPARLGVASLLALVIGAASAQAETLVGLTDDGKLLKIDTATMTASPPVPIFGSSKVVGIDARPADGKLYGLTADSQLVMVDHVSGKATPGSKLSEKVTLGPRPVVDFNPVADRLRVVAADGVSLRINVDGGATIVDKPLNYDATDANSGKKPMIVAGAYTNSVKGAKGTELFHVDGGTGALVLQNPPNDGVLKTRGMVGVASAPDAVMDIATESEAKNVAWLIASNTLYTIDLATGKATQVGTLKGVTGRLVDIAAIK